MTAAQDREARETRRAAASLVRRLQERDEAIKNGQDVPDWEPFAAEYIAALRGQGWRWLAVVAPHRQQPQEAGQPEADAMAEFRAKAAAATEEFLKRDGRATPADPSYPNHPERTIS